MTCSNCQTILKANTPFCVSCGLIFIGEVASKKQSAAATTVATAVKADPLSGRTLDGKYELQARLGQGGMGMVYRARRVQIGDEVAVKVLHPHYSAAADVLVRFRREAQAAATLRHPNVVTIYDYSESDALAYLVMEFVPGLSLGQLLKDGHRLPLARAVALMQCICAGVGAAHRRNIVHRDLKPDNIIVVPPSSEGETETVKVVDFGIAKLRDLAATQALTETGMIIGTPFYMSPEQCRGEELDARSDVYSLGVMFYEMIAGMRPFTAPTPTGVIAKHLTQAPPPLHPTLKIPRPVEAVLMRTLAKDPNARPADALAFAQALETALRQTATAMPAPPLRPARSHGLRNALLVIVALFCLIVGGAGWLAVRFVMAWQTAQHPAASPTPNRAATNVKPSATPTPKATVAIPRPTPPNVAVVHQPTPPPLGIVKGREPLHVAVPAVKLTVGKSASEAKLLRRISTRDTTEQMPPEVRRMFDQLIQRGVPTDGKVKTVYVTRPTN